jgi:hypothetical protein
MLTLICCATALCSAVACCGARDANPGLLPAIPSLSELFDMVIDSGRIDMIENKELRKSFRVLPEVRSNTPSNHTHPDQAQKRHEASLMIRSLALTSGLVPFMHQYSERDISNGLAGSRAYFWMKDASVPRSREVPAATSLIGIVDTDYYMDMPNYLLSTDQPVVLYTMQPHSAGEINHAGVSFHFDENSNINAVVAGGARYGPHPIWDYGQDVLTVRSYWGLLTKTYNVERFNVDKHHSLILLVPIAKWSWLSSLCTTRLSHTSLQRLAPVHGDWAVLKVYDGTDHKISVARVNSCASVSIPLELDSGFRETIKCTKNPLTVSSVESCIVKLGLTHSQAALLCAYYRSECPVPRYTVFPMEHSVRRFQFRKLDLDAKPALVPFMSPIVNDAITPDPTRGNEQQAVAGRIENIRTPDLPIDAQFVQYLEEFTQLLIPEAGVAVPVDEEYVWQQQKKPTQRQLIDEASTIDEPVRITKTFMKKEAYGKVTDPRIISTINPKDKLNYSEIMYGFVNTIMKGLEFYAFGKTPVEIANRVAKICREAETFVPSDYTRLDGTISNLCRLLEEAVMMRAFDKKYHERVRAAMATQHHLDGVGTFGTWYQTVYARLSGSAETSVFNTLVTIFVAYIAYRKMGLSSYEAFFKLGIYGGDDGGSPDMDLQCFQDAAKMMGLTLKASAILRGQPGVTFLARLYTPEVWMGNPNSCCDLKRQLSKFHTTVNKPEISAARKLREKAISYYFTDANTPIIGPFCHKVIEIMLDRGETFDSTDNELGLRTFASLCEMDEQYPNEECEFFHDVASQFPHYDKEVWEQWLDGVEELTELLKPPCISSPPAPVVPGVFVNGEAPPLQVIDLARVNAVIDELLASRATTATPSAPPVVPAVAGPLVTFGSFPPEPLLGNVAVSNVPQPVQPVQNKKKKTRRGKPKK